MVSMVLGTSTDEIASFDSLNSKNGCSFCYNETLQSFIEECDCVDERCKRDMGSLNKEYGYNLTFEDFCVNKDGKLDYITDENGCAKYIDENGKIQTTCYNCEQGTYESADRSGYCACDQGERCFDYFTKSTAVAGGTDLLLTSCAYQERTDNCYDSTRLREYFIDCNWKLPVSYEAKLEGFEPPLDHIPYHRG